MGPKTGAGKHLDSTEDLEQPTKVLSSAEEGKIGDLEEMSNAEQAPFLRDKKVKKPPKKISKALRQLGSHNLRKMILAVTFFALFLQIVPPIMVRSFQGRGNFEAINLTLSERTVAKYYAHSYTRCLNFFHLSVAITRDSAAALLEVLTKHLGP